MQLTQSELLIKEQEFEDLLGYPRRERRQRDLPGTMLYQAVTINDKNLITIEESLTVEEALTGENKKNWKKAMNEEFALLQKNDAWELVDLPEGRKAIDSKWVFRMKRDNDENVSKYKTRLVARGFTQKYQIDYDETFSLLSDIPL